MVCSKCKTLKLKSDFYKGHNQCKKCLIDKAMLWKSLNRDKVKRTNDKYYSNNSKQYSDNAKKWREKNPKRFTELMQSKKYKDKRNKKQNEYKENLSDNYVRSILRKLNMPTEIEFVIIKREQMKINRLIKNKKLC